MQCLPTCLWGFPGKVLIQPWQMLPQAESWKEGIGITLLNHSKDVIFLLWLQHVWSIGKIVIIFFILNVHQTMTSRIKKYNHDSCLISKFVAYRHQNHRIKYNLKWTIKKKIFKSPKEQLSRVSNGRSHGISVWVNVFVTFSFCLCVLISLCL